MSEGKSSGDGQLRSRTLVHLVSGGAGGTMGAILTCPFEVVKTRLQSSSTSSFHQQQLKQQTTTTSQIRTSSSTNPLECMKLILRHEGPGGLFKGLGPNLLGVAPARAIYFWAYSSTKARLNASLPHRNRDTPFVHILSAASAGFTASSVTNPIWLIKTRLQLDHRAGSRAGRIRQTVASIFEKHGPGGFWKGVTASYWGISETAIHFVIYEYLKSKCIESQMRNRSSSSLDDGGRSLMDFLGFMVCGACSKTCATVVAYPHEVARTRLREDGSKYNSFWQTLGIVYREEGRAGLYRGLLTQLIRQIPNTAIMMGTYELSVTLLSAWLKSDEESEASSTQELQRL
eukprot:TRINITY_DN2142_c0_g2_i1.p1 TRINITY_DN2142_c0_g2~~TRINITY_DN2142_c0_g2_i1.p1  ORF type:complete len:345 (+),score=96.90 TRINITY_DN2142_c0_g2_i1:160-1194(+)